MDAFVQGEVDPRDEAMEDYMQNVDEFGLRDDVFASAAFARREMDLEAGSHNDWESTPSDAEQQDEWDSDALRDFDGLSTSSDVVDTIVRVISKRKRNDGIQYLIVYEGSTVDDARWLPATFLKSAAEQELVRIFEAEMLSRSQRVGSDGDSDPGTDEVGHESEEESAEIDDARLARVLQKQEELGIGSEEVLLYGDDEFFDGPVNTVGRSLSFDRPNKKQIHRARRGRGNEPSFPSAAAMADALDMDPYSGFDIMDTERPSLRRQKKGRRGQMPPELDDSDLNEQLQTAWAADRARKRLKKAEREELRRQGLLGRKGKAPDLSVKYKDGIDMMEVIEEIREFMMSESQT